MKNNQFVMSQLNVAMGYVALAAVSVLPQLSIAEESITKSPEQVNEQAAHALETVQVTATATNKSTAEVVQPVSVLSGEELDRQRAGNLGETLALQPGIHNNSYGAAVGRPIIRGLGGARVKVLQDGIDTLDASSVSPDHAVNAHTHGAKQIEILRGPATLLYGGGAFGGVVNVVDQRVPHDGSHDSAGLLGTDSEVRVQYDSVNNGKTLGLKNEGEVNNIHWHLDASSYSSDDYELPKLKEHEEHEEGETEEEHEEHATTDKLANSDVEKKNQITLGTSYDFGDGHVGIAISRSESEFGLPGHVHEEEHDEDEGEEEHEEHEEEGARIDMQQTRIDVDAAFEQPFAAADSLNLRLGVNDYKHDEIEDGAIGTRFKRKGYEGRSELILKPVANIQNVVGIQPAQDTFEAIGDEAVVPKTDSQAYGLFWLGETQLNDWTLEAGARFDQVERSPETPAAINPECGLVASQYEDKDFSDTSLSFGVIKPIAPQWQISASVTSAARAPETQELFSCGAHAATQTFDIGAPNLDSEQALNFDFGIRKTSGDLVASLNLYQNSIDDFIYQLNTGDVVGEFGKYQFVQQDATFVGGELDLAYTLMDSLAVTAMADRVRGQLNSKDSSGNDELPRMPADRFGFGLEFNQSQWSSYAQWVSVQKQDEVASNEEASEGYDILNAGVSYNLILAKSEYRIDLKGTNLLDEEIRYHTSFVKEQAPQPGRGISLGLVAKF